MNRYVRYQKLRFAPPNSKYDVSNKIDIMLNYKL